MLKFRKNKKSKSNEKGMAIIEALPVLFMVVFIFNFSLGFFGATHSGILNSIAAYNYTLETFRFRSNLIYFRPGGQFIHYGKAMNRVHGITGEGYQNKDMLDKRKWPATVRGVKVTDNLQTEKENSGHERSNKSSVWRSIASFSPSSEDDSPKTAEIWIKTVYGICLNADCEPKN